MIFPNCREDIDYNQAYLDNADKEYLKGMDFQADQALNFFNNMDAYEDEFDIEGEDINLINFLNNHSKILDKLKECIDDWLETQRDEMITSMIDNMDEEEYKKNKEKNKSDKFYDTRKMFVNKDGTK